MFCMSRVSRDLERSLPSPQLSQRANMNASIERRETSSSPNTKTTSHIQNTTQHASQRKRSCRRRPPRPEQQLRPQRHQRAFEPREQERRCRCLLLCCKRTAIPLLSAAEYRIERGGLAMGFRLKKGSEACMHMKMRWNTLRKES